MPPFMIRKSTKIYLGIILLGLVISSLTFVYYGFNLGIKPCNGFPSDAANCGDADLGGIGFILIGIPIVALGVVGFLVHMVWDFIKASRRASS